MDKATAEASTQIAFPMGQAYSPRPEIRTNFNTSIFWATRSTRPMHRAYLSLPIFEYMKEYFKSSTCLLHSQDIISHQVNTFSIHSHFRHSRSDLRPSFISYLASFDSPSGPLNTPFRIRGCLEKGKGIQKVIRTRNGEMVALYKKLDLIEGGLIFQSNYYGYIICNLIVKVRVAMPDASTIHFLTLFASLPTNKISTISETYFPLAVSIANFKSDSPALKSLSTRRKLRQLTLRSWNNIFPPWRDAREIGRHGRLGTVTYTSIKCQKPRRIQCMNQRHAYTLPRHHGQPKTKIYIPSSMLNILFYCLISEFSSEEYLRKATDIKRDLVPTPGGFANNQGESQRDAAAPISNGCPYLPTGEDETFSTGDLYGDTLRASPDLTTATTASYTRFHGVKFSRFMFGAVFSLPNSILRLSGREAQVNHAIAMLYLECGFSILTPTIRYASHRPSRVGIPGDYHPIVLGACLDKEAYFEWAAVYSVPIAMNRQCRSAAHA
ncbi:uncharacterized protein BDR25DRAFT_358499 [Lindgomyces ingoldianus]|uniref:Uncharacterized protein n=1 Tax=Lindgomyces ingoldianus TaxID=673940 RepID=A0ACB6QKC1_9PLEO|nr:uncharacterized protein BDR25DRAFT_358499 [Lindgomyces ingoldianus]KAF2467388.1 hypothetical protein BDR25DRAFT_358499 [Lindgomyces ingoldianus]